MILQLKELQLALLAKPSTNIISTAERADSIDSAADLDEQTNADINSSSLLPILNISKCLILPFYCTTVQFFFICIVGF